jgi:hypothetical protein
MVSTIPAGVTIAAGFRPRGGHHCVTNALASVLAGRGHEFSEAMLFGLGGSLGFVYLNLGGLPFIGGRNKTEEASALLEKRLGLRLRTRRPADGSAFESAIREIDAGRPVMVYADMPYLGYLNLPETSHFGGHAVVIGGYDRERRVFLVSDRDAAGWPVHTPAGPVASDWHEVGFDDMARARGSAHRPFPARNAWVEVDDAGLRPVDAAMLAGAIRDNMAEMLQDKAQLLGAAGIRKLAAELSGWARLPDARLRLAGISNHFMVDAKGGTGGGLFRRMYAAFLGEAAAWLPGVAGFAAGYRELAAAWDRFGAALWELGETGDRAMLASMSWQAADLAANEEGLARGLLAAVG